jgi:TolA-binding protein
LAFFLSYPAFAQSIDGLQGIVSSQQEKITTIENTLKTLIGSVEQFRKDQKPNKKNKLIQSQINEINDQIIILKNKISNITELALNIEFSMKRIEKHLQLSSMNFHDKPKVEKEKKSKSDIKKSSLVPKTDGVLGFIKESNVENNKQPNELIEKPIEKNLNILPKLSAEEQYNFAYDITLKGDYVKAEKVLKEFLNLHKEHKRRADAQFWLGRVYYNQKKYEEAAIALAEFNSIYPNDARFQKTTLLIAEAAFNFAPKDQLCDILSQSLEFMINPSEKFKKRINSLKLEKQCLTE